MLEAFYGMLTALEGHDDNRESQLQLCMKALEVFPLDAQLLCAIGGYLQSRELLELASRSYHIAAEHGHTTADVWHLEGLPEIALNCYALTLQLMGRDDEARAVLEKEMAANPAATRLRRQLLELHVRHARRDEALAVVSGIPRSVPNREALRSAVRGACLAAEANWIAARSYLETAYKAGCREPLCLRWLTATYLAAGQGDEAQQMLDQWSRIDPLSPEMRQYRLALAPPRGVERTIRVDEEKPAAIPAPVAPLPVSSPRTPA
jgi:tetratricopeptide (TPR) repeat protein